MEAAEPSVDAQGAAAQQSLFGDKKTSSKPVWVLLEEAAQMKTEGNAFYREKNIRSAIGRYHRALLVLRSLDADVNSSVKGFGPETPDLTSEQEATLRNIQVDCYNNLAGTTSQHCLGRGGSPCFRPCFLGKHFSSYIKASSCWSLSKN